MSQIRNYRVTQEREVTISATSPVEAVELSASVFDERLARPEEIRGNVLSSVREINVSAREEY